MSKPFMLIQAPVQTRSGYGAHARDLVKSLIAMDKFDIKIIGLRWGNTPMNALDLNNPEDKAINDRIIQGEVKYLDNQILMLKLEYQMSFKKLVSIILV